MSAAVGMVLVAFGAICCVAGGGWLLVRARRSPDVPKIVGSALAWGGAAFAIVLLVSGLRHFGGRNAFTHQACAPWWVQIDSPAGLADNRLTPAPGCRQAALHAVGTVLTQSALIAAVWVGVVGGYLAVRRRTMVADAAAPAAPAAEASASMQA